MIIDLVLIENAVNDRCFLNLVVIKTVCTESLEVDLLSVLSGQSEIHEALIIVAGLRLSVCRSVIDFDMSGTFRK